MRRRGFAAACLGAAVASLAGCAGGGRRVPTTVPTPAPHDRIGGALVVWVPTMVRDAVVSAGERFSRTHPGVSVHVQAKTTRQIVEALGRRSGDVDLAWVPHGDLGVLTSGNALAPVQLGGLARALNPLAVGAFTEAGQLFALPCTVTNVGMVRNTSLTTTVPATWTEAVGTRAPIDGPPDVLYGAGASGDAYSMFGLQTSFGNTAFALTENGTIGPDLTLGDDAGLAFATWLYAEGAKGLRHLDATMSESQAEALFRKGAAPYLITGESQARDLQASGLRIDVLPIPSAGGQETRPFLRVEGLVVPSGSHRQDTAAAFLVEAMATVDTQAELSASTGAYPALADALKAPPVANDVITTGFAQAGNNGIPTPSLPALPKVWQLWGRAESRIIAGADPQKTWTTMADQVGTLVNPGR